MRESALTQPVPARLALAVALLASAAACSTEETPGGGLLVAISVDPSLNQAHLTRLSTDIGSIDGGTTYRDAGYAIDDADPSQVHFPTSLGIDSNGDPNAAVAIVLGVWDGTQPLDIQRYWVTHIPTTSVAELPVVFGSSCATSGPLDGGVASCPLENWCSWRSDPDLWVCDGRKLPGPGADAGWPAQGTGGATLDAALDEGADATLGDADAADATLGDAGAVGVDAEDVEDAPLTLPCDAPCGPGLQCVDGTCVPVPPSCSGGGPGAGRSCGGATGTDDCCASDEVAGGAFWWEDATIHPYKDFPASVEQFRLDRYEVTVGRFREFIDAVSAGDAGTPWAPAEGTGMHTYLNGGLGLASGGDGAVVYETGWNPSWNAYLPQTKDAWDAALQSCAADAGAATWTPAAGADEDEKRPINCVNWYESYAFCIWDHAFLPSDVEWDYAAAGGDRSRNYAWGPNDPGLSATYAVYACYYPPLPSGGNDCQGLPNIAPVGSAPAGHGVWDQLDLTGNVFEWTLDYASDAIPLPCADCAETTSGTQRGFRGGGWDTRDPSGLFSYTWTFSPAALAHADVGVRCARGP